MNIKSNKDELSLLCTKSKYGNFKEGKIYKAIAFSTMGKKSTGVRYTDFKITDEEGDFYSIRESHLSNTGPLQFREIEIEQVLESFSMGKDKVSLLKVETNDGEKFSVQQTRESFFGTLVRQSTYEKEEYARSLYYQLCEEVKFEQAKECPENDAEKEMEV